MAEAQDDVLTAPVKVGVPRGERPRPALGRFLSMWMSNTASCLTMMPIALAVIRMMEGEGSPSEVCLCHYGQASFFCRPRGGRSVLGDRFWS